MTSVDVLSDVIWRIVSAERALDAEAVAGVFEEQEWQIAGSTSLPFPRKWSKEGIQASIFGRDDPSIEFTLKEIPPDWDNPEYAEAVNGSYAAQARELDDIREALFGALGRHVVPEFVGDVSEIEELLTGSDWAVNGATLSIGVAHLDPDDLPILLLVYLRQGSSV